MARNGGRFHCKPYAQFLTQAKAEIAELWIERGHVPLIQPLVLVLRFDVQSPQKTKLDHPRPDVDNYAKAVMDSMNGLAFVDDTQVAILVSYKRWVQSDPCIQVGVYNFSDFIR